MARKSFSRAERRAYYSGMGSAVGSQKRRIKFKGGKSSRVRRAFAAGRKKGNEMMGRNPSKYPKLKRTRRK